MLSKIRKLLVSPRFPIDVDQAILEQTCDSMGTQFPHDYLEFARLFGSGTIYIGDIYHWEFISPFRPTYPRFVKGFFDRTDEYRKFAEPDVPFLGLYPEPGGLLPFGQRDDLYFTWKTEGKPDAWTVVVFWLYEPNGYQHFKLGFLEFLHQFLLQKIQLEPFRKWEKNTRYSFESQVFAI